MDFKIVIDLVKWGLGLIVVVTSLYYTIRHFKITRTLSYIERFNTPSMIQTRKVVDEWSIMDEEEKLKSYKEDFNLRQHIALIYSLITEIGISYQYGVINRKMTCLIFDPLIPNYWEKLEVFIIHQPKSNYPYGYSFKKLVDAIIRSRDWKIKKRRVNIILKEIADIHEKINAKNIS